MGNRKVLEMFDFHMSVHRKYISKVQPTICNVFSIYLFLYIALHVSGGSSAHHQEHKTVHTASGTVEPILLPAAIVNEMELRYFYKLLYTFQAVPPPIIRSTKLHVRRQVLSNQYCCLLLSWIRWNRVPSHPRFRRFLRPSSGAQNCIYGVRYFQTNTAACCYRGWDGTEFHLIHDSSRQQYWFDNTWRCMYSFVLLMMGGGTVWNMQSDL
jgi:hypothetical protein